MTAKKKSVGGFQIFNKPVAPGEAQGRVALNHELGAAYETAGEGKYFGYIGGRQFPFESEATLEEICAGDTEPAAAPASEDSDPQE